MNVAKRIKNTSKKMACFPNLRARPLLQVAAKVKEAFSPQA